MLQYSRRALDWQGPLAVKDAFLSAHLLNPGYKNGFLNPFQFLKFFAHPDVSFS